MPSSTLDAYTGNQVRLVQSTGKPDKRTLESIDYLLVVLPAGAKTATWKALPQGEKLRGLRKRSRKASVPSVSGRIANKRQTGIAIGELKAGAEAFERLTFARRLVAAASVEKFGTLGLWVHGFDEETTARLVGELAAAALAAAHVLPHFKSKAPEPAFRSVKIIGNESRLDLERVEAEAAGNNLARSFTGLPSNKLDAVEYCRLLEELAKAEGWQFRKFGVKELEKKGAGAFLAVAQGNGDDSAAMVRLRYRPGAKTAKPRLTLVGKGIIFDTGGTNLKPFNAMLEMHVDMGGSAVAVGCLLAIAKLGLDVPVDCWLAVTENRTGPQAYKSQDVVTAANGKTIQVIHTDAEGRMALADALHFASLDEPGLMIDYATLTGACMTAVTTRYSGVFTNRPDLHPVLKKCGRECGERVWPFPVDREFLEELKSDTADLKQCSPNGGGDHILAATFLNEFVAPGVPWVHVDLSACMRKGGLAHVPTTITGFGVRYTMSLLLDHGLLDADLGSEP